MISTARYFLGINKSKWYIVEDLKRGEWEAWRKSNSDEPPKFVRSIKEVDKVTFENPILW